MAADKRNFDDFENFPGVIDDGTGYHVFPTITYTDSADRVREWTIRVRLIKAGGDRLSGVAWDLLEEKQVVIKKEYYGHGDEYADLPKGTIAEAWVETGISTGKITRNSPSYFEKVALSGQINQRNQLHNALIYARSQYLKRIEKHSKHTPVKAKGNAKGKGKNNVMHFPMLATSEEKGMKHLNFPIIVQPKLDGTRANAFLKYKDGGPENVIIYTRTKKVYPDLWYLQVLLYPYLNELYDESLDQSIFLDGELYKHGKALQEISGSVRRSKKNRMSKRIITPDKNCKNKNKNASESELDDTFTLDETNEYHVYDCYYPLELDTSCESRMEQLDVLFEAMSDEVIEEFGFSASDIIKEVPRWKVKDMETAIERFDILIAEKYEGIIMRNMDGIYTAGRDSTTGTRSKDLVKMKQRFTDEFECIGYTQGKRGKDRGAVIWIIKTNDGEELNVTPKDMTYDRRYELFQECEKSFDEKYLGLMLTCEYEDLSNSGKPLRAKSLTFRDYE
jgi:ATP-dependent DNA ligase